MSVSQLKQEESCREVALATAYNGRSRAARRNQCGMSFVSVFCPGNRLGLNEHEPSEVCRPTVRCVRTTAETER